MSLSDWQTAAVTGASSGIGAAVAHALSRRGLKVHAIARREDRLAQQTGCVIHAPDIRETEALVALLGSLKVDVLVNNAGVGWGFGSLADADPIDIDCTLDTNVRAAVHAVRAVLPSMIERGTGPYCQRRVHGRTLPVVLGCVRCFEGCSPRAINGSAVGIAGHGYPGH